jgi:cell division protein FtsZ
VNVAASSTVTLHEVNEAINHITERADPEANIIFGTSLDETLADEVQITVIATGFAGNARSQSSAAALQRSEYPYGGADDATPRWSATPEATAPSFSAAPSASAAPAAQPPATPTWTPVTHPAVAQPSGDAVQGTDTGVTPSPVPSDELEIPAFLRRRS